MASRPGTRRPTEPSFLTQREDPSSSLHVGLFVLGVCSFLGWRNSGQPGRHNFLRLYSDEVVKAQMGWTQCSASQQAETTTELLPRQTRKQGISCSQA